MKKRESENVIDDEVQTETAILAGGCFWGMQDIIRKIEGLLETRVGYCGGVSGENEVNSKKHSGPAESVLIKFNPEIISYRKLLTDWFFRMHDPTTLNRQGNDVGSTYRSAIFYVDEKQRLEAMAAIEDENLAARWKKEIVTSIEPAQNWTEAEEFHQDYLIKNPGGYTCHWLRKWD